MDYKIIIDENRPYESACEILQQTPVTKEQFSFLPEEDQDYALSIHRITTVVKAQQQRRTFDWNNYDQYKYYPWWDMETYEGQAPGSGFSYGGDVNSDSLSSVGARLCSHTSAEAEFIAKAMIEDYRIIMKG